VSPTINLDAFEAFNSATGPHSQPYSLKESENKYKIYELQQPTAIPHKLLNGRPKPRIIEAIKYNTFYFENITTSNSSLAL
jgi:hypothetical protein